MELYGQRTKVSTVRAPARISQDKKTLPTPAPPIGREPKNERRTAFGIPIGIKAAAGALPHHRGYHYHHIIIIISISPITIIACIHDRGYLLS